MPRAQHQCESRLEAVGRKAVCEQRSLCSTAAQRLRSPAFLRVALKLDDALESPVLDLIGQDRWGGGAFSRGKEPKGGLETMGVVCEWYIPISVLPWVAAEKNFT